MGVDDAFELAGGELESPAEGLGDALGLEEADALGGAEDGRGELLAVCLPGGAALAGARLALGLGEPFGSSTVPGLTDGTTVSPTFGFAAPEGLRFATSSPTPVPIAANSSARPISSPRRRRRS